MKTRLICIFSVLLTLFLGAGSLRYIKDFWLFSFTYSFQLHIGITGAVAAIIFFLVLRSRYMLFLLAWAIALSAHATMLRYEFVSPAGEAVTGHPFKLISFNVLGDNYVNGARIADFIARSGADVVYVMEGAPLAPYLARIAEAYPHRIGCMVATETCDLLVFSKYPLEDARFVTLSDLRRDRMAVAKVTAADTTINLVALHVTKPYFDDYHEEELHVASRIMRALQGPLIVGGDFNSSAIAPDMRRFQQRNNLHVSNFEPATWPIEAGHFGIPIDHVFSRMPATMTSLTRLPDAMGSNHYGLEAEFNIQRQ
ncbi:endonuclease/exonuclease/phosphatase family protein [Agrobacterium sp.]|jgi:endonuclease/exonuclease/phosphatase (EEP) superfamily protein YafD|uniref:endonuclease/exonuclease/phosphatase family protein n=1 Tax=Agrobacterium sp. TaxID=361 RepID=UPI0028B0A8F3|nr:endonuclease/exonuclease/phosphatase family protein [Agrobacterium sp.]